MADPLQTLRDALGEAMSEHSCDWNDCWHHRAESALRELERVQKQVSAEAEPRYTVEEVLDELGSECGYPYPPYGEDLLDAIKRRLAEREQR